MAVPLSLLPTVPSSAAKKPHNTPDWVPKDFPFSHLANAIDDIRAVTPRGEGHAGGGSDSHGRLS